MTQSPRQHPDEATRAAVEAELGWLPTASPANLGVSVNHGVVELSGEVVDSPQAVITMQVESGIVVRMAVLYEVLAGRAAPARTPEPQLA